MDMGDAPGWAGAGLGLAALFVSLVSVKHSRRSAGAAEESATAAAQSVVETRRSSDAAERSATAAEETLADQRREAAERRAAEAEANRPRPRLVIEHRRKALFRIVNMGSATAENIRLVETPEALNRWPDAFSLGPGDDQEFLVFEAGWGMTAPASLRLAWDGQDEPVVVRLPERIG
jgi:hypothetical protein